MLGHNCPEMDEMDRLDRHPTASNKDHEYLGDGVYASHDGFQIWLDLRAQDQTTAIALEPSVMANLIAYAKRIASGA